jgi:hypothetical protein
MGYYDCKKKKYITDEEKRKLNAKKPYFSEFPKLINCRVCENYYWCNNKNKDKTGCENGFELDELSELVEVYRKQRDIK